MSSPRPPLPKFRLLSLTDPTQDPNRTYEFMPIWVPPPRLPPAIARSAQATAAVHPTIGDPKPPPAVPRPRPRRPANPDLEPDPTPGLAPGPHPIKDYGKYLEPVDYTLYQGSSRMIGSQAYYQSWAYRKKKAARKKRAEQDLGPILELGKTEKKVAMRGGGESSLAVGEGVRKVDERERRYLMRQVFLEGSERSRD